MSNLDGTLNGLIKLALAAAFAAGVALSVFVVVNLFIAIVINNLDLKTEGYDDYYYQRYHSEYKQDQAEVNS